MNGYSKIRVIGNPKSKSMDFSDLLSPQMPKPISDTKPNSETQKSKEIKDTINGQDTSIHDLSSQREHVDGEGEKFGVILNRNYSLSSTSSKRFGSEKPKTALQSAVKRAFSMKRSNSVSEGYSRIHDQCDPVSSPSYDDGLMNIQSRSKKKKSKILKACKRLFGL